MLISRGEELNIIGGDFQISAGFAITAFMSADAYRAGNGNLAAFAEIRNTVFSQFAPSRNAEVISLGLSGFCAVITAVHRNSKVGNRGAVCGTAFLRIVRKITYNQKLIDKSFLLFSCFFSNHCYTILPGIIIKEHFIYHPSFSSYQTLLLF